MSKVWRADDRGWNGEGLRLLPILRLEAETSPARAQTEASRRARPLARSAPRRVLSLLRTALDPLVRMPEGRGMNRREVTPIPKNPTPKRKRKRLPPMSDKRRDEAPEREACRVEVLRRAGGRCQYEQVVEEISCGFLPDRCGLEVDELRGGSFRAIEYLDPDACRAVCPKHHDHKTAHKNEVLGRLAIFEGRYLPTPRSQDATQPVRSRPASGDPGPLD